MSTLYISEYADMPRLTPSGQPIQAAQEPSTTTQVLTVSGASVASAAFASDTKFIRVHCDGICSLSFGAAPVALTTHARLAASTTEYFGVIGGQKVAAITNV